MATTLKKPTTTRKRTTPENAQLTPAAETALEIDPKALELSAPPAAETLDPGAAEKAQVQANSRDLDFVLGDNAKSEVVRYANTIIDYLNEIDALKDEIKGAKVEAKGNGFDVNAIMKVVNAKRKGNHWERVEKETIERLYMLAADLPIAQ